MFVNLQSYIEPGTGKKLRSLAEVERYLKAGGDYTVEPLSVSFSKLYTSFIDVKRFHTMCLL